MPQLRPSPSLSTKWSLSLLVLSASSGIAPSKALAVADPTCVNYYTVGDSDCRPAASTPVKSAKVQSATEVIAPVQPQSEVDKYLANYGKPPREFVEFYLNPTPENANKWVQTYQGMIQKGQDLSKAWSNAEQLYAGAQGVPQPAQPASLNPPLSQTTSSVGAEVPSVQPTMPVAERIGAFAGLQSAPVNASSGIQTRRINLTYYFSQTCPYCARMTPQLSEIALKMQSKLVFTCVDVTPLGATSGPNEAFITSKLPCKWRLPTTDEVEKQNIQQTPTLLVGEEGKEPVRLSGYVPLEQLKSYFMLQ